MANEGTYVIRGKRRRSSLFLDPETIAIETEQSIDYSCIENVAGAVGNVKDGARADLLAYVAELDNCKQKWKSYREILDEQLASVADKEAKLKIEATNNYINYLDKEDAAFLEDILQAESLLNDGLSETLSNLKLQYRNSVFQFEEMKQKIELLCENLETSVVAENQRYEHYRRLGSRFDEMLQAFSHWSVDENGMSVLEKGD